MADKLRWYKNRKKIIHSRSEAWFDSDKKEKLYKDNFIRINGEDDMTIYVEPKPKPKPKPKAKPKAKAKKVKKGAK